MLVVDLITTLAIMATKNGNCEIDFVPDENGDINIVPHPQTTVDNAEPGEPE